MIPTEARAFQILARCRLRMASAGKRFVHQMADQPDTKLTERQARLLWSLVWTYRRQVPDAELLRLAGRFHATDQLPDIYQPGDHRELPNKVTRGDPLIFGNTKPPDKPTRLERELAKGKGHLKL